MAIARHLQIAARIVAELPVSLDRIPYTPEFDLAHERLQREIGLKLTKHESWWKLQDVRKRGLASRPRGEDRRRES